MMSDQNPGETHLDRFVVFEGLDGAGTTTQVQMLVHRFREHGKAVFSDREPTDGPIGRRIRHVLSGSFVVRPETLALLFAADRREHMYAPKTGVYDRHSAGGTIVCDRYVYSSLAYQGVECGIERVQGYNAGIPVPGYLFYLDVPVEQCLARMVDRPERDIFEHERYLRRTAELYEQVIADAERSSVRVYRLDGTASPEEIHELVWSTLSETPIL